MSASHLNFLKMKCILIALDFLCHKPIGRDCSLDFLGSHLGSEFFVMIQSQSTIFQINNYFSCFKLII